MKVQDVSKELGVRYVLEGSVRKADNQVRITAQLIDATTGGHLWAERYDRPLKDIFALQDEIVQKIVTTLKLQLTLWSKGFLVRKTTDNLEAYDLLLARTGGLISVHYENEERGEYSSAADVSRKPLSWIRSMRRRMQGWVRVTGSIGSIDGNTDPSAVSGTGV